MERREPPRPSDLEGAQPERSSHASTTLPRCPGAAGRDGSVSVDAVAASHQERPATRGRPDGSITPIRVTSASLPLFVQRGSQIQRAEMATKRQPRLSAAEFRFDRIVSSGSASRRTDACSFPGAAGRMATRRDARADDEAGAVGVDDQSGPPRPIPDDVEDVAHVGDQTICSTSRLAICSSLWRRCSRGDFRVRPVKSVANAHVRKHAAPSAVFQFAAARFRTEPVDGTR